MAKSKGEKMKDYTEINVPSEETTLDTTETLAPDGDLRNDGSDALSYYSTMPLDNGSMSDMAGETVVGYGAGESHRAIIENAGGEIGYDGFNDPRPNESGSIVADRVFINQSTNEIQGINFNKNGAFCCSYTGMNYNDIKNSNDMDCKNKN